MADITAVLIPGLVSDARVWQPVGEALAEICAVHRADVQRDSSIRAMAARLLDEVGGQMIAVGHSMGGRVAMEMARQAPERVRALVLSNTGHNAKQPGEDAKRQAKIDLGHQSMERLALEWIPPMLDTARTGDAQLVAELTGMVLAAGAEVHERQIRALLGRPDAAAYLPSISCPILLLTGAQDRWSPETQHRKIAELAPDAELHVIDRAGHFLPMERPEETAQVIVEWLTRRKEDIHD
jgi:pimeloyl-ACP methyl ester carboxylesterase